MAERGITRRLAEWAAGLRFSDLPAAVVERTKLLALDYAGVLMRGRLAPSSRALDRALPALGVGENAPWRALRDGTHAHSIEMDDVHDESSQHPAVAVFPAAFAVAAEAGAGGRDLIAGVVAGYEVMNKLGKAVYPASAYERGFHPTGINGAFGAAAAAGRILGLGPEEMTRAFGIAGSMAAGSMEYLADGAWTKRLHAGWAAHAGVVAAYLARSGYSGPATIVEGRLGYLHAHASDYDPRRAVEGLGDPFEVMETSVKLHACCRYMHGPIDAVLRLRARLADPEAVERVECGVLSGGWLLVADPIEVKRRPASVVDAQFSMPFGAAVALARGQAFVDEFTDERIQDPAIRALMQRVDVFRDPELDAGYPAQWRAAARVRLRDGQVLEARVDNPRGSPRNFVTQGELRQKFDRLVAPVLNPSDAERLSSVIWELESIRDGSEVASLLDAG